MKTELAPTSSDLSLLPRADLPVIWDGFRAKAEELRTTAETLTVTSVEQEAEMELARTTRLTLKQIRVEVEKKRIELGEGHLTEIQKINGAAKKIKEMIEPLEARLLSQETFAERAEADRVLELTKRRIDDIRSVSATAFIGSDLGKMPQEVYDGHMVRLRAEVANLAEAKRRQAEAEAKLAEEQAEAKRQAQAAAAEAAVKIAAERAELQRRYDALQILARQEQAEKDRLRDEELKAVQAKADAQLAEARAEADRQQAENERIQAELEVQLANERVAKLAEEERLRKLAVAPDLIKLRAYYDDLKDVPLPNLSTQDAERALIEAVKHVSLARTSLDIFCKRFEQG